MTTPLDVSNRLSHDAARLESLLESAQLLHASLDLEDLLRHLLRSVMGRLMIGRGLVAVEQNGEMCLRLVRGMKSLSAGNAFDEAAARAAGVHLLLPIGDAARPVGLLGLGRPPSGSIDTAEDESLKALLGIAASGIANARAHAETNRVNRHLDQKVQDLRALLDLVRGLSSTLEPDAVASLLMLTLAGRFGVRRYALMVCKENHPPVVRQKGMSLPAFENLEAYEQPLRDLPEAIAVDDLPDGDLKETLIAQSGRLLFPLRTTTAAGERPNGLVVLGARGSKGGELGYTSSDMEFGAGLIAQAGVAFENAWYVRETLERKKIEQELELAASIQEALFPATLPAFTGYDLAARNRPARQCGGDYYDALPIEDARNEAANGGGDRPHLFCVADVSGKGLPASLLMSNVQATLRALLGRTASLADLAAQTSELLYATTPSNKYVTAILAEFDPLTGTVNYVNGGHNGGLLLRAASGEHEWLKPTGTPIGLFAGMPFEEAAFAMQPGDLLTLFSDGVPEAQNVSGEEFGEERLLEFVRTVQGESATEIVARIFAEVDSFAGSAPQFDDITVMVIKRGVMDN